MENLILGFLTGGSLILAIGPQNLFVIEQSLKKNFIFTITSICAVSDVLLIFLGIFIYNFFDFISWEVEVILNIILVLFLIRFIKDKVDEFKGTYKIKNIKKSKNLKNIIFKTLGFTYLNPHVYSDTVFFLGNFSKNFPINYKIYFGIGGSIASFLFFYLLGYLANYFSKYLNNVRAWVVIKWIISLIMSLISIYVIFEILKFFN